MHIKGSERGVVRVFHIDLPREAMDRFTTQAGTGEWPLQYALGAMSLRADFVDVIDIRDLGEMTLSQYLATAHDITGAEFENMRAQLDALTSFALVLPSQAFNQTEQHLTISSPLRWMGTFNEPQAATIAAPIHTESAKGIGGGASAPAPKTNTSVVMLVLVLFGLVAGGIILAKVLLN